MLEELKKRVDLGHVSAIPDGRLTIFNYTNHCVFENGWDEFTMAARGLVLDDQGKVIARPFKKFFNLNQRPETRLEALPAETPELSEKYDGSLLIVFMDPYQARWRAITRGCWENVQTKYAETWLKENRDVLDIRRTYLFELIAPWNRIVIPYDKEDMVLLGIVDTASGKDWSYAEVEKEGEITGLRTVEFESKPLDSIALDNPKIRDKEGFVARFSNGLRVKLKYTQYIALHKVLTGLSVKGIWEILSVGNDPNFENVPDEFMDWYRKQRDGLKKAFLEIEAKAQAVFQATPKLETRKDYAMVFTKHGPLAGILFSMLDKKPYAETIWNQIKPHGPTGTFQVDQE